MNPFYDLVIRNGKILDGAGNPPVKKDIGILESKIEKIGCIPRDVGREEIDADGMIVSPGFIDLHNHCDQAILAFPDAESSLMQGVTTSVVGNCGLSMAPVNKRHLDVLKRYNLPFLQPGFDYEWDWTSFKEYYDKVQERGIAQNLAPLVGHGAIRVAVKGFEASLPSELEMQEMKRLLSQAMEEGAFGLSTGLIYPPGSFSRTEELVELAGVLKAYGGIYVSHIRNEGAALIESVDEAIQIAEINDIPVEISHHKAIARSNWGKIHGTLKIMKEARSRGVEVSCDVYPYIAASTTISSLLPDWVLEGGIENMLDRIRDRNIQKTITDEITSGSMTGENWIKGVGWENIYITDCPRQPNVEGKHLKEICAKDSGGEDLCFAFLEWLLYIKGEAKMAMFGMCEEDVITVLSEPTTSVISDSWILNPSGGGKPHPRTYGSFPRVLGRYVREKRVLSLEDAVRKMTSQPAAKIGLEKRGLLVEGFWADIVIFNPDTISDRATFKDPHQYPEGISQVIVMGSVVAENGRLSGERPGQVLKRS